MKREFSPDAYYRRLYDETERALSFSAETYEGLLRWQAELKQKLTELLGGFPKEKIELESEVIDREKLEGYTREKIIFESEPSVSVPAYLLIPDGLSSPAPAVIALHGHGPGKIIPCGIAPDEESRKLIEEGERDYAVQAVKRGYVAIVPDMRSFGERMRESDVEAGRRNSCEASAMRALMLGKTLIGERVWDTICCIDYLETRDEVDPGRICCMGQSGGGTITLFSAALEKRIKAAVVSCYFCTFRDSIMSVRHCPCNYVPGLLKTAEMCDIAGLICPRPLYIIAGKEDPIFPIEGVKSAFEILRNIYHVGRAEDKLGIYIGDGGHRFYAEKVWEWIEDRM